MPYTHEVRFTRVFTGGTLNGLRIENERVRFGDVASAHAFIQSALKSPHVPKPCNGGSPYRIENPFLYVLDEEATR